MYRKKIEALYSVLIMAALIFLCILKLFRGSCSLKSKKGLPRTTPGTLEKILFQITHKQNKMALIVVSQNSRSG